MNYQIWGWGRLGPETIWSSPVQLTAPYDLTAVSLGKNLSILLTSSSLSRWTRSLLQQPQHLMPIESPSSLAAYNDSILIYSGYTLQILTPDSPIVELSFPAQIKALACGSEHILLLDFNGLMYAWGQSSKGRLGLGQTEGSVSSPTPIQMKKSVKIQQVACGYNHSLALSTEGIVYSWGSGADGRLGLGDDQDRLRPTIIPLQKIVSKIQCGYLHSAVLTSTGELLSCGFNGYGSLGLGNSEQRSVLSVCYRLSCVRLIDIGCGAFHTICVSDDGCIYSVGLGQKGQLGTGVNMDSSTPCLLSFRISDPSYDFKIVCGLENTVILSRSGCTNGPFQEQTETTIGGNSELFESFNESMQFNFRPSNLPAKDPQEAAFQHQLVAQQARLYLQRIRQKQKQQRRIQEKKLEKEALIRKNMLI